MLIFLGIIEHPGLGLGEPLENVGQLRVFSPTKVRRN
jgi:hypothetical protein